MGWLLLVALGCGQQQATEDTAPRSCEETTLEAREVLETRCYTCHGLDGAAQGGLNYILDVERLLAEGQIDLEDPASSALLEQMSSGAMPPREAGEAPSEWEIGCVRSWLVDCGAPAFSEGAASEFVAPETAHAAMLDDLDSVGGEEREFFRYISLVHLRNAGYAADEVATYRVAISLLLNGLSFGSSAAAPEEVTADELPSGSLYRIDLRAYAWQSQGSDPIDGWERLIAGYPLGEPEPDEIYQELQERAGSRQPHVQGDWLIWAASQAPLYYRLLRAPGTADEFLATFGVDRAESLQSLDLIRAGFTDSEVAENSRIVERHGAEHGYCWLAYDFDERGEDYIFEHPLDFEPAQTEILCALPNKTQAYFLADAEGLRLDEGDPELTSDPEVVDRISSAAGGCLRCHDEGVLFTPDEVLERVGDSRYNGLYDDDALDAIAAIYTGNGGGDGEYGGVVGADSAEFAGALSDAGVPSAGGDRFGPALSDFEAPLDLARAAATLGEESSELADLIEEIGENDHFPESFDTIEDLTREGETVDRQAFLEIARDLLCYLDDPVNGCDEPAPCGAIGVGCLEGQGCVTIGEDAGVCLTCDGEPPPLWGIDDDGDGYLAGLTAACEQPEGYLEDLYEGAAVDCDDTNPSARPGHDELCDGIDNDCDGLVDNNSGPCGVHLLADAQLKITGALYDGHAGRRVAGAGDVNGDALADLLLGAPEEGDGAVYLILGGVGGELSLDDPAARFAESGAAVGDALDGAGDVDGDGLGDLIVSALGEGGGVAYLLFGPTTGADPLSGAGRALIGERDDDGAGAAVAGVEDADGDGLADLLVGAPDAEGLGAAYLVLGPVSADRSLADADAEFISEKPDSRAGYSVADAGDLDGDGLSDLLIGAPGEDDNAGACYAPTRPFAGLLSLVDHATRLNGEAAGDGAGYSIAGVGDVNGDGYDDLLVGAYGDDDGGDDAGAAYLILGPVSVDRSLAAAAAKFTGTVYDYIGWSVSGAGDVDGDGLDDLLIGARLDDEGGSAAGAAYLIREFDYGARPLVEADAKFIGEESGDQAGFSVAGVGDADGDGFDDLLIGAPDHDGGDDDAGAAYLIFGGG